MPKNSFELYFSRGCIDNSERNSCTKCIGVLGVYYSIPGSRSAKVDKDELRFTHRGYRYVFKTPPKLAFIAQAYDEGKMMKRDINPWRETIRDPVFAERSQHRKTSTKKRTKRVTVATGPRISRWSGKKI